MLVEAETPSVSTADFSKSLDDTIKKKQEFLKTVEETFTKNKKQLEDLITDNKMHLDQIENSIRVSKSNPDEVRQLTMEKTKLQKHQGEIRNQMTQLEKNKQEAIKSAQEEIKNAQDMKNKLSTFDAEQAKAAKESEAEEKLQGESIDPERKEMLIRRNFARMEEQEEGQDKPKKTVIVNFDKSTQQPFQVKFTERGFLIGDTRLSFEILEVAISKEFNIVLNNGTGLVLDSVRMQKILKYKDRV